MEEQQINNFCDNCCLKSLVRQPTLYKSPSNATCIDLIVTNVPQKFQSTCVLETGLANFQLMTVTVMRKIFKKLKPLTIRYRSYKHSSNEAYRESHCVNYQKGFLLITMTACKGFVISTIIF